MPSAASEPLGEISGTVVDVQHTCQGQDILIMHGDLGQRLACLLGFGRAEIVRRDDAYHWRIMHDKQVDELLIELIDLLVSIRYAHPAMVQLEMVLEPDKV